LTLGLSACGGDSDSTTASTTAAPTENYQPVANAGVLQNVLAGTSVTLDGSASSDVYGDALTYTWRVSSKPSGSVAALSSTSSVKPTFTADKPGNYVFILTVSDEKLTSSESMVTVSAAENNVAPVAHAGAAQNVVTGTKVTLDGSASSDANGDVLSYAWIIKSLPTGSAAVLSGASSAKPTFMVDVAGNYTFDLTVSDGKLTSKAVSVTVSATVANAVPVAIVKPVSTVNVGAVVTLDGSGSTDANGDPLIYAWTMTSKPSDSMAAFSSLTEVKPFFTADKAGDYVVTLKVSDGIVASNPATVTVKAVKPSVTLYQTVGSLSTLDSEVGLPYSSSGTVSASYQCIGSGCSSNYPIAAFKLVSGSGDYTVVDISAVNKTDGASVVASFVGLSNGQLIANGATVPFTLESSFTQGKTVNLEYKFKIKETGDLFTYNVQLTTN